MLAVLAHGLRLQRNQHLDAPVLAALRQRKLRKLVMHAYNTTAYYRERFDAAGVDPRSITSLDDLSRVPASRREDLQTAGIDALTSCAFAPRHLTTEKTSGSSGRPLAMRFDRRWIAVRNAMFLRALSATGYRPGRRVMLVTGGERRDRGWPMRWRYVPFAQSPAQLLDELNRFRPWLVYGWVTPLRRLAEHVRDRGGAAHRPRAIVTTAEALDAPARALLAESLGGAVYQIYGLTEMGAMAWECAQHAGMHVAADTVIVEAVQGRLLLTNLELFGTPLLRYDCGDAAAALETQPCPCGCTFDRLPQVEGRLVDCVRLADGRVLSPYQLTLAMEEVTSVRRYRIIQTSLDRFEVQYVVQPGASDPADQVRAVLGGLLGRAVRIAVQRRDSLDPPPGCKFRVVECRLS